MAAVDPARRLAELVIERPDRAAVLDRFELDYCCRGDRTLAEACAERRLDVERVAAELAEVPARSAAGGWEVFGPHELIRHIVETHHRYLHEELGQLEALATEVECTHGRRHRELEQVRALLVQLHLELEAQVDREERYVFPALIEAGRRPGGRARAAIVPVEELQAANDRTVVVLRRLREVTGGYRVPDDACLGFRSLYERLERLERDIHLHVHKENNLLIPSALRGGSPGHC